MYFIVYFYYALFRVVSAKTGLQCILFILDNGDCLLTRIIFSLCFFFVVFFMSLRHLSLFCAPSSLHFPNTGPDYEAQFDPECWPHSQSHQ